MTDAAVCAQLRSGETSLGIELGSTRIKAVLIGADHTPLAAGSFDWESHLEAGYWTYRLSEVWVGIQTCFSRLAAQVAERYGVTLTTVGTIGVSAMMHGYLAFDSSDRQLASFRTWRNVCTAEAADVLTDTFAFHIPQRWSIAHLYQAMRSREPQAEQVAFLTTLAGYVHWRLTGQRVLGVGDASGVFPVDGEACRYHPVMLARFADLAAEQGYHWHIADILPQVLPAGICAGRLTAAGARLLDPRGLLAAGIPFCPPEGDAGTGMVATNSIAPRTGNVSAGTSIFSMVVLEHPLRGVYPEIDLVTTPTGHPVAMVHCNNCSSDLDAWAEVLRQFSAALGTPCSRGQALDALFAAAGKGAPDCGGLVACNYIAGEPITGLTEGRPLTARLPDADFTLPNFARSLLYAALATLKIGMDLLTGQEQVQLDSLLGHGGFFKAEQVGQTMLAAALNTPVSVMETAGEGGPWGMALLAAYLRCRSADETLDEFLSDRVFASAACHTVQPDSRSCDGFAVYLNRYRALLAAERAAAAELKREEQNECSKH